MATKYVERVTPTGGNDIDDVLDQLAADSGGNVSPVVVDATDDKMKIRNRASGLTEVVVTDADVEVASVDDVTIEYADGAIQVKDEGITADKIAAEAVTSAVTVGESLVITIGTDEYTFVNGLLTGYADLS
jgi:hypothetical protein